MIMFTVFEVIVCMQASLPGKHAPSKSTLFDNLSNSIEDKAKNKKKKEKNILENNDDFNLVDSLSDPYIVQVPSFQPITRSQFMQASSHWPTSFHEDKQYVNACL